MPILNTRWESSRVARVASKLPCLIFAFRNFTDSCSPNRKCLRVFRDYTDENRRRKFCEFYPRIVLPAQIEDRDILSVRFTTMGRIQLSRLYLFRVSSEKGIVGFAASGATVEHSSKLRLQFETGTGIDFTTRTRLIPCLSD